MNLLPRLTWRALYGRPSLGLTPIRSAVLVVAAYSAVPSKTKRYQVVCAGITGPVYTPVAYGPLGAVSQ